MQVPSTHVNCEPSSHVSVNLLLLTFSLILVGAWWVGGWLGWWVDGWVGGWVGLGGWVGGLGLGWWVDGWDVVYVIIYMVIKCDNTWTFQKLLKTYLF